MKFGRVPATSKIMGLGGRLGFEVVEGSAQALFGRDELAPAERLELGVGEAVALPGGGGLVGREDGGQLALRGAVVALDRVRQGDGERVGQRERGDGLDVLL